jgi:hypothetical protein
LTDISYTYTLNLTTGTIVEAFVSDYLGDQYNTTVNSDITPGSKSHVIHFTLPEAEIAISIIAYTMDTNIEVSYKAVGSTTNASAPAASKAAVIMYCSLMFLLTVGLLLVGLD